MDNKEESKKSEEDNAETSSESETTSSNSSPNTTKPLEPSTGDQPKSTTTSAPSSMTDGTEESTPSVEDEESSSSTDPESELLLWLSVDSNAKLPNNWRIRADLVALPDSETKNPQVIGPLSDEVAVKEGKYIKLRLPNPPKNALTNGFVSVFLSIYADLNEDSQLSNNDLYVAASSPYLLYNHRAEGQKWYYFDRTSQEILPLEETNLKLTRIDRNPQVSVEFGGSLALVPSSVRNIAAFSPAESNHLANSFNPAPRSVDFLIADSKSSAKSWSHSVSKGMSAKRRRDLFSGLSSHGSAWLIGYSQPAGMKPGPPVTPKSIYRGNLCSDSRAVAVIWIEPTRWIQNAIGASLVAHHHLHPGWNLVSYHLDQKDDGPVVLRHGESRNLYISERCRQ